MENILKNKPLIAIIFLWTFINILFLSFSQADADFYKGDLWPFTVHKLSQTYDLTEFILYVLGPIIIGFVYSLIKSKNEK